MLKDTIEGMLENTDKRKLAIVGSIFVIVVLFAIITVIRTFSGPGAGRPNEKPVPPWESADSAPTPEEKADFDALSAMPIDQLEAEATRRYEALMNGTAPTGQQSVDRAAAVLSYRRSLESYK